MSLPRFGVTKPVPINLLMMAVIIFGVVAAFNLRREFFPETTPDRARLLLPYPGATPAEIEESMAHKVEDALADLDEIDRMETSISEGVGSIMVEFRSGVDVDKAVDKIKNTVDALTDLPEEAEDIRVAEFEPNLPVIMVTIHGDADEEVMKRAIRTVRDDLRKLPGMGDIITSGVRGYEVRVDVSDAALLEHGISLPQVSDAIRAWMSDLPGGSVRTNVGNINVRTVGVPEAAEAIKQIVVKASPSGQALRVGDIARVHEDFVDEQMQRRFNGQPAVSLTVFKTGDQDAVQIAEMVRAYVAGRQGKEFSPAFGDRVLNAINTMRRLLMDRKAAPLRTQRKIAYESGVAASAADPLPGQISTHSDLARFIEGRLHLLTSNAQQGAALVFLTLLLFLNWRAAFWVMMGLVFAICGTIVLMSILGITLNLLTMFGLIIVVGMLVDDGIVVAENIQSRHDRGESSLDAAIKGTEEVFWPVVGTVTTTIVAFFSLMFIKGRIGDLLGALPWVVACALFASMVEALVSLPSHMGHSLINRDKAAPGRFGGTLRRYEKWRDHIIADRVLPAYAGILRLLMAQRYITSAVVIAVLILSIGMVTGKRLPFTFLADSDAETIVIDLRMPIGTALTETQRIVGRIENAATAQPEVKNIGSIVGQRASIDLGIVDANATHLAQMYIELHAVEQRQARGQRQSQQVIAGIRAAHGILDGVENLRYSEIGGAGGGADITLQVTGDDAPVVNTVVSRSKTLLAQRHGVYDIADDNFNNQREVQINLKPGAASLGFTVADVARQVRGALYGLEAHTFSAKREDIDVRVRLDESSRHDLGAIENMWVIGPNQSEAQARRAENPLLARRAGGGGGASIVPLREIADLSEGVSFSTIRRIDRERAVTITADTAPDTNPEDITADLAPHLDELRRQFPGVGIETAGRQRDFARAFSSLPLGMGAALLMIYVILAWLFSSYVQPLIVMLAIPFGLIGVIWGHVVFGYQATFLSLIGFIALCGIVVNNSLILVEFFNTALSGGSGGTGICDALVEAGKQRLRPIFLTSITTFLGLTPLMLQQSFQAKFLIPMAISISFGLLSSTVLVLTVLPCFLVILDDLNAAVRFVWFGPMRATVSEGAGEAMPEAE